MKLNKEMLFEAQRLSVRASLRVTLKELEHPLWNKVQQDDRLLGCSLTGWMDMVNATKMTDEEQKTLLKELRDIAYDEMRKYADELGVNHPLLVTTIKPEGTLSQLPTVSSGVHYPHSEYFIRRVRVSANDPILKVCEELGYVIYPEIGQTEENCSTKVVEFYCKAPEGLTKYDVTAIDQLENYKMFMEYYVDHNCSITITVRDDEWEKVEDWLWENWDSVVAVSFLPLDDSVYQLAPYEKISKEMYDELNAKQKRFVPSLIQKYEKTFDLYDISDNECASGVCPVR